MGRLRETCRINPWVTSRLPRRMPAMLINTWGGGVNERIVRFETNVDPVRRSSQSEQ